MKKKNLFFVLAAIAIFFAFGCQKVSGQQNGNWYFTRFPGGALTIPACDGSETLYEAGDVFSLVDPDLQNWGLNKPSQATAETAVQGLELVEYASFYQIFGSRSSELDKLCLTQNQIKVFCSQHPDWFSLGDPFTIFLFKSEQYYFVVRVEVTCVGLWVVVYPLDFVNVWMGRIVVPKL